MTQHKSTSSLPPQRLKEPLHFKAMKKAFQLEDIEHRTIDQEKTKMLVDKYLSDKDQNLNIV